MDVLAQDGLARKQSSTNTYSRKTYQRSIRHDEQIEAQKSLHLSGFEKLLMVVGVVLVVATMISIITIKNSLNASERSLQTLSTQSSKFRNQNQSLTQELDGIENNAINRIVKKDKLSLSDTNVRDITR